MAKEIIITFDETTGEETVEARGFTLQDGKDCAKATKPYEAALGVEGSKEWKPEARGTRSSGVSQGQGA